MAEALGKFEHEILELSPDEFARWSAYFKMKKEMQDKGGKTKGSNSGVGKGRKVIRRL